MDEQRFEELWADESPIYRKRVLKGVALVWCRAGYDIADKIWREFFYKYMEINSVTLEQMCVKLGIPVPKEYKT